jgi:hypothetical protein
VDQWQHCANVVCVCCCWRGTASEKKNDFHVQANGKRKTRNYGNFLSKGCSNLYSGIEWFKTVRDGCGDLENNRRSWRVLTALNLEGASKDRQLGARNIRVIREFTINYILTGRWLVIASCLLYGLTL